MSVVTPYPALRPTLSIFGLDNLALRVERTAPNPLPS